MHASQTRYPRAPAVLHFTVKDLLLELVHDPVGVRLQVTQGLPSGSEALEAKIHGLLVLRHPALGAPYEAVLRYREDMEDTRRRHVEAACVGIH